MRKLKGYENAKAYSDNKRLPVGGYVLKVLNVEYQENSWGDRIILSFDIAEGEQKDFYAKNYKNQTGEDKKWKGVYRNLYVPKEDGSEGDERTMRSFKTVIEAFKESNPGLKWEWDEQVLKGKLIGGLFNNKEFSINGRNGFYTNCKYLTSVNQIRENEFEIPADDLLSGSSANQSHNSAKTDADGFMSIPDGVEEELPF